MFSSTFVHWILFPTLIVVTAAFSSLEYSGAHRSSPVAPLLGSLHHNPYAALDGFTSSPAGNWGNLSPEYGYTYQSPHSFTSVTRRINAYQGYPGAHHPGAFAPQLSNLPYGTALGYNAPSYAPAYPLESGHYMANYGAYVPAYTPSAAPANQHNHWPAFGQGSLYAPGASYAPAYSPGYHPHADYVPPLSLEANLRGGINPLKTGLPLIAIKKRSLSV